MGRGWNASFQQGRRDRLKQEVLHRVAGGPKPTPIDYKGHDGTHGSYYRRGWETVDIRDIIWECQRYKEERHV